MVGFGNPLLDGNAADEAGRARAERARATKAALRHERRRARRLSSWRSLAAGSRRPKMRGGLVDRAFLKAAPPLPDNSG